MCVTDRHDMTLAVKVALNPNTTNQPNLFRKAGVLSMLCENAVKLLANAVKPFAVGSMYSAMGECNTILSAIEYYLSNNKALKCL